jgi:hypothetical protein
MSAVRVACLIAAIALLGVAGWLLFSSSDRPLLPVERWEAHVGDPILIGDEEDPFVYAGGPDVRPTTGTGEIRVSADGTTGLVRISVDARANDPVPLAGEWLAGEFTLQSRIGEDTLIWTDVAVHGDTGRGEARLPEAHALLAGTSPFELVSAEPAGRGHLDGIWSIANALRKADGSIRQQGLVYSPLLRDKKAFADAERREFTLLLYTAGEDDVVLHLVFRQVDVTQSPSAINSP